MTEQNPVIEESNERRGQRQIVFSLARFGASVANAEEPTEEDLEQFCEFMRGIDAHRTHRPLVTECIDLRVKQSPK